LYRPPRTLKTPQSADISMGLVADSDLRMDTDDAVARLAVAGTATSGGRADRR